MSFTRFIAPALAAFCAGLAAADDAAPANATPEPPAPAPTEERASPVQSDAAVEMMKSLEDFMARQPQDVPKGTAGARCAQGGRARDHQNAQVLVAEDAGSGARVGQARSRCAAGGVSSTQTWTGP